MSNDNAIVISQGSTFIEPAAPLDVLNRRYATFTAFVKQNLRDGFDFLVIPGTGTKPSLVKPGAEKLCTLFGLSARFVVADLVEDWTGEKHNGEMFFYYRYRCGIYRGDLLVAECEGSCNSWERKYRYRQSELKCPACGKTTIIKGKEEYGGGWICFAKKGGCGAKYQDTDKRISEQPRGQVVNADIADQVNTLQKMAQKRAFVGATLLATNASEFFTQDIEDMPQFVDAVIVEAAPVPTLHPLTKPAPIQPQAEAPAPVTDETPHVVYTGPLIGYGAQKRNLRFPQAWMTKIPAFVKEQGYNAFEVAEIMWSANLPQDTPVDEVIYTINEHLAAKPA